jgi:molybdate transport system substrate-binding protein
MREGVPTAGAGDGSGVGRPSRPRRSRRLVRTLAVVGVATLGVALTACSSSSSSGTSSSASTPAAGNTSAAGSASAASGNISGTVVVFAATSLTEAFDKIGAQFEAAHPGVTVKFNYNGSSSLATSINQGAPADVFASAAPKNMDTVTTAGNASGSPQDFARNTGEIMVEKGNPKNIKSVSDLANPAIKVVVCAPEVPCGQVATAIFKNAGVTVKPVSEEQNVGGVVTKVSLGEADAGIVYVTDVKASEGKATGVPIPADQNDITAYPIAELKAAPNPAGAAAFISYVLSPAGQQVLASYGFLPPG